MSKPYHFKVMYEELKDGSYQAWVPMLPACQAQGASVEQARDRIADAIHCYCLNMMEHGAPIPQGKPGLPAFVDEVQVCVRTA